MSDPSHRRSAASSGEPASHSEGDGADGLRALPALTHVAVALRHDRAAQTLPRIVASGRGAVAEQILAVAQAEGISVRKDADLAEVLVALEVGSDIPVEAFAAVAEILSYIYRANQIHGAHRADQIYGAHRADQIYGAHRADQIYGAHRAPADQSISPNTAPSTMGKEP